MSLLSSPAATPSVRQSDRMPPTPGRITGRAVLIALVIIPAQMYWVGMVEGVWHGLHFTCLSLPMTAVFFLLCLMAVNGAIRRLRPKRVLTQAELLTIFCMLAISGVLCGHDRLVTLMGIVAHAHRFASPENRWEELFFRYLSPAWVVTDREAAFHYYTGGSSYRLYWRHWVAPAVSWTCFSIVLVYTLLCLNVILRRRWTEAERLSYPIVQIPLALTDPRPGFWRSPGLWIGFGLAGGVDVLNGFAYLYPSLPSLNYYGPAVDLQQFFPDHPWRAIGPTRADCYPFMIGLAYFLPMDIIFSTWFFYLVGKLMLAWGAATGLQALLPRYPYFPMQAAGAVMAIALVALWEARGYLLQVGRRALGLPSRLDDAGEAMSYRAAVLGAGSGALILAWLAMTMGMSPAYVGIYFALFFLLALAVARLRADSGAPAHGLAAVNPHEVLIAHTGTAAESPRHLTAMALCHWFNRFNRAHPMPQQLEAFKIAQVLRQDQRRMAMALMLASIVTLALAFVIYPMLMYRHGAALAAELVWTGWATYGSAGLQGWLQSPRLPDPAGIGCFWGGGAFALFLALMRARFVWWPFHPMGYALGLGTTVDRWWCALLVCTLVKGLIVRYAGVRGYRRAAPFFAGLVLGQYVVLCLWSLVAVILEQPMYWSWLA